MTSDGRVRRAAVTRRRTRGSTLVELVVALSLLALALGGIYAFVVTGGRSARITNNFLRTQAQVRAALDNFVDEIRWAEEVTAAGPTAVTLLIPGQTPFSGSGPYTVTFAYDAAADTVTRQVGAGPAEPIAYHVVQEDGSAGVAFLYFTGDGQLSDPPNPAVITRIRLTVTTTRDTVSRTFTGDVALRGR